MDRAQIINMLIAKHDYRSYLEIGVRDRWCINQIQLPEEAKDGVDPEGNCKHQMTSDEFFANNTKSYDLVFIDGNHEDYQVIKDIHNAITTIPLHGTIVLHDCYPPTEWHQRPIEQFDRKSEWNGTVWKAFVYYTMFHKDVDIDFYTIDCDWGVGVLHKNVDTPREEKLILANMHDLSYKDFSNCKKEWLNLITPAQFREKLLE